MEREAVRPPDDAITIYTDWSRIMADEEWVVWDDPNSETWWHTTVTDRKFGAVFAILYDDYRLDNDSDTYSVFLGALEGREPPSEDAIPELGRTAIAVYSQYFHESRGKPDDGEDDEASDLTVN